MGLFNRGKKDDVVIESSKQDAVAGIDFSKYDLSTLGDDVASIVSIPKAVAQTAKWALGLPILIGILSWAIFSSRMSTWILVPFVLGAMVFSVAGSVFIGGFFVARKRLDTVSEATARVVTVVNDMHRDVVQLKDGASTTSVKAVATGLLENAIFPMAFGFVEGMAPTTSGGLVGRIGSLATDVPMKLVQRSTIAAIDRLPDKEIGKTVDDLDDSMPEMAATLSDLNASYQKIAGDIEGVVGGVSKATLTSVISAAALAMMPLLGWLVIGWIAS